jgi:hypothetical protein
MHFDHPEAFVIQGVVDNDTSKYISVSAKALRRQKYHPERVYVAYCCFQDIITFAAKKSTSDGGLILWGLEQVLEPS